MELERALIGPVMDVSVTRLLFELDVINCDRWGEDGKKRGEEMIKYFILWEQSHIEQWRVVYAYCLVDLE